jgi:hypothetical protein
VPKSLSSVIRDKIDAGVLPVDVPVKLWIGRGTGKRCIVCGKRILTDQTEYEPQDGNHRVVIRLDARCHRLWQAERRRRGVAGDDC